MRVFCPAVLALLAGLVLAGCGGGSSDQAATTTASTTPPATAATTAQKPAQKQGLFDYDRSAPLAFRDKGDVNPAYPIRVHDVSFAGPKGRVTGYLLLPPVEGRRPAVIYMHGSGGNRTEFLAPAGWLAARGAIGLTLDSPEARSSEPIAAGLKGLRQQRDLTAQAIVELRRAVDLLQRRPDVDPNRIAYVGWSYGARTGALLAGVEHRIRAYDLISAGAEPVAAEVAAAPPDVRPEATKLLTEIDPIHGVGRSLPGTVFLQDGAADEIVPQPALDAVAEAAPKGSRVKWYAGGHAPGTAELRDSLAWLSGRLGLATSSRVPGAAAGP
jgi:dienelactone hydrolase